MGRATRTEEPASAAEAGEVLRVAAGGGHAVRIVGGGTKLGWGHPVHDPDVTLSTTGLSRIVEHNAADLTAVLEAGVPLARAQAAFAEAGQMLALDPPLGPGGAATVGGIVAAADSGPLRHRYGSPRDLVVGMTVALSDGTVARSGGKVIKNVAGYDLGKLFAGSFGSLGVIVEVVVRLHPLARGRVTAIGSSDDLSAVAGAASALAHEPLVPESLDVWWQQGSGMILARFAGAAPRSQADRAVIVMRDSGLRTELQPDDGPLWERQRAGQRDPAATVIRVSGPPARLAGVLARAERIGGSLVGRASLGLWWLRLPDGPAETTIGVVEDLRRDLAPSDCVVLNGPEDVRRKVDVWGIPDGPELDLMRRVKARFDPAGIMNPGLFVGGI